MGGKDFGEEKVGELPGYSEISVCCCCGCVAEWSGEGEDIGVEEGWELPGYSAIRLTEQGREGYA